LWQNEPKREVLTRSARVISHPDQCPSLHGEPLDEGYKKMEDKESVQEARSVLKPQQFIGKAGLSSQATPGGGPRELSISCKRIQKKSS
jgi:hypothetical protein